MASETVAAPPASSPLSGAPAVLGAGLVAAAGLVLASQVAKKKPAPAPTPVAPTPTPAFGAPVVYPRVVSRAAQPALNTLATYFPNAVVDTAFVKACAAELFSLGFTK